jgi:hypothetical protein
MITVAKYCGPYLGCTEIEFCCHSSTNFNNNYRCTKNIYIYNRVAGVFYRYCIKINYSTIGLRAGITPVGGVLGIGHRRWALWVGVAPVGVLSAVHVGDASARRVEITGGRVHLGRAGGDRHSRRAGVRICIWYL